mgnify:CR=1 FL=1
MTHNRPRDSMRPVVWALTIAAMACWPTAAFAQVPTVRFGDPVPRDVRDLYDAGCRWLVKTQAADGAWPSPQQGPGVTGMAMMVLLASGEDPNFGPYRTPIRRALRNIITAQDASTGVLGGSSGHGSMYQHGFAMLALAEAYGVVDDRTLWNEEGAGGKGRSIAEALDLAVQLAVKSAKTNPTGAWRYSPESRDADTSVSGAILVGLLAARNAGLDVPQETLDRALKYYVSMTGANGMVSYSGGGGGSNATTAIGALVFAIGQRKTLPQYEKASNAVLGSSRDGSQRESYGAYTDYYRAQALLQIDTDAWAAWNQQLVARLKSQRQPGGEFTDHSSGMRGPMVDTSLSLLALAVNYRFLPIYER